MKKVICDHCKKDLSNGGGYYDWRLCLKNESIPPSNGAVIDICILPIIHDDYGRPVDKYFCGMSCLKKWVE